MTYGCTLGFTFHNCFRIIYLYNLKKNMNLIVSLLYIVLYITLRLFYVNMKNCGLDSGLFLGDGVVRN